MFAFAQTDNKQQTDLKERGEESSFVKMPALFKKIILSRIRFMVYRLNRSDRFELDYER